MRHACAVGSRRGEPDDARLHRAANEVSAVVEVVYREHRPAHIEFHLQLQSECLCRLRTQQRITGTVLYNSACTISALQQHATKGQRRALTIMKRTVRCLCRQTQSVRWASRGSARCRAAAARGS